MGATPVKAAVRERPKPGRAVEAWPARGPDGDRRRRHGAIGGVHRGGPRDAPGRARFDAVIAGVDGHAHVPHLRRQRLSVAQHLEPGGPRGHLDGQLAEPRSQRGRTGPGRGFARGLAALVGLVDHVEERRPRAREAALVLQAIGQVELGADGGREALALLQLRASLGPPLLAHQALAVVEEDLRRGHLVAAGARRACHRERGAEQRGHQRGGKGRSSHSQGHGHLLARASTPSGSTGQHTASRPRACEQPGAVVRPRGALLPEPRS